MILILCVCGIHKCVASDPISLLTFRITFSFLLLFIIIYYYLLLDMIVALMILFRDPRKRNKQKTLIHTHTHQTRTIDTKGPCQNNYGGQVFRVLVSGVGDVTAEHFLANECRKVKVLKRTWFQLF